MKLKQHQNLRKMTLTDKEKIKDVLSMLEQLEHWEKYGWREDDLPHWVFGSLGALPKTQKYVYPAYLNEIRHRLEDEKK